DDRKSHSRAFLVRARVRRWRDDVARHARASHSRAKRGCVATYLNVVLIAAAFVAGLVDAIAGGGGLVTLPALLAAGLPPHVALGTNKGQAVFGATTSALSFWRRGMVDRARAPVGFAAGFAGSCLGVLGVLAVPLRPLRVIVIVLLLIAAAVVLARRNVEPR